MSCLPSMSFPPRHHQNHGMGDHPTAGVLEPDKHSPDGSISSALLFFHCLGGLPSFSRCRRFVSACLKIGYIVLHTGPDRLNNSPEYPSLKPFQRCPLLPQSTAAPLSRRPRCCPASRLFCHCALQVYDPLRLSQPSQLGYTRTDGEGCGLGSPFRDWHPFSCSNPVCCCLYTSAISFKASAVREAQGCH